MAARLLEGAPAAKALWARADAGAESFATRHGRPPHLAVVCGEDEAARAYARQIERQFGRHAFAARVLDAPGNLTGTQELLRTLSADPGTDGILVMAPLPGGQSLQDAVTALDPRKDVDGQHPSNLGLLAQRRPEAFVPGTALGGLRLLEHYQVPLRGARAVVVGRSPVVGIPLAHLLLAADATVTVCHSRTVDLAATTRTAEILCVATGQAGLIGPEHVNPGATVIDFGTNPTPDGGLVGDVRTADVMEIAGAITPVPGGTGPMTVAILAEQTLRAAEGLLSA